MKQSKSKRFYPRIFHSLWDDVKWTPSLQSRTNWCIGNGGYLLVGETNNMRRWEWVEPTKWEEWTVSVDQHGIAWTYCLNDSG